MHVPGQPQVRVYLTNVEGIARRFVEERKEALQVCGVWSAAAAAASGVGNNFFRAGRLLAVGARGLAGAARHMGGWASGA